MAGDKSALVSTPTSLSEASMLTFEGSFWYQVGGGEEEDQRKSTNVIRWRLEQVFIII